MKEEQTGKEIFIDFIGDVMRNIGLIAGFVLQAIVITILWGWFISSVFNLPPIEVKQALGLLLFGKLFFLTTAKREDLSVSRIGWYKGVFEPIILWVGASLLVWWLASIVYHWK